MIVAKAGRQRDFLKSDTQRPKDRQSVRIHKEAGTTLEVQHPNKRNFRKRDQSERGIISKIIQENLPELRGHNFPG